MTGSVPRTALAIDGLSIAFELAGNTLLAVRKLSLHVNRGETYGLVGESGCGKSTTALAMLGYLPANARLLGGSVLLEGEDVLAATPDRLRQLRGPGVAMVQQDPVGAFNPVMTLGAQLLEVLRAHRAAPDTSMHAEVLQMLRRVALPQPESFMPRYPHQVSGGQLQRIAIAMALLARPRLLVLDEPTTGLDVTIEAEVARLVADLAREFDMAVVYISHNLGLIRRVCGRIGIMYAGEIVEQGSAAPLFAAPVHPYTRALVACLPRIVAGRPLHRMATIAGRVPRLDREPSACAFAPRCPFVVAAQCVDAGAIALKALDAERSIRCVRAGALPIMAEESPPATPARPRDVVRLAVESLYKRYGRAGGLLARMRKPDASQAAALSGVTLDVAAGEIVALVGESGSGKSSLARVVAGLEQGSAGTVRVGGLDVAQLRPRQRPPAQLRAVQIVFQNPDRTLNPSQRVGSILGRALRRGAGARAAGQREQVAGLLSRVSLPPEVAAQWPHALSGGQRQRVAIARALAGKPELILADEPVSALDVSVQGAIINLLLDERERMGTSMLFISHDLALVHAISDRVVVLRSGKVMEAGPRDAVFSAPFHPYTRTLLAAAGAARDWPPPPQGLPDGQAAAGCVHAGRCHQRVGPVCWQLEPPEREVAPGHRIACHRTVAELHAEPVEVPQITRSK